MSEDSKPVVGEKREFDKDAFSIERRRFLGGVGLLTALGVGAGAIGLAGCGSPESANASSSPAAARADNALAARINAAQSERGVAIPAHVSNGDEQLYPNRIGNFAKGLPHDNIGEVNPSAYQLLLDAVESGSGFDQIPLGGTIKLANPQSGLAFDLEGTDCEQLGEVPAPALASAERAGEAVEDYWAALLRDVPFSTFASDPSVQAALADMNRLSDFRGPKQNGQVSAATFLRGTLPGDLIGPYVSQFFFPTVGFGATQISQQYQVFLPLSGGGADYLVDFTSWLAAINGKGPFPRLMFDTTRRFIRNGRDLSSFVHVDVAYQAFLQAALILSQMNAPLNPGNPYRTIANQAPFGTFGAPHLQTLVAEVVTRALKAVWHDKWFVHRTVRPEEYGGLVHKTIANVKSYPVHADVLNSQAVQQTFNRNSTYLLPIAFPEGCPQHPSYGEGHGVVAGACVTILKAWFDGSAPFANPVMASADGTALDPYTGSDANQITVTGELNKLASNMGMGRCLAGMHWRSDYLQSVLLGEQVALSVLRDQRNTYVESFNGFTFTLFDGTQVTV